MTDLHLIAIVFLVVVYLTFKDIIKYNYITWKILRLHNKLDKIAYLKHKKIQEIENEKKKLEELENERNKK